MVELTLALHRVFDSPRDADRVGHRPPVLRAQAAHRPAGALRHACARPAACPATRAGPRASTTWWRTRTPPPRCPGPTGWRGRGSCAARPTATVVAVVGDGALTGGMAWEALNNLGAAAGRPVVVVLNDNGRSYAPTVGAASPRTWPRCAPAAARRCSPRWGWATSGRSTATTSRPSRRRCARPATGGRRPSCTAHHEGPRPPARPRSTTWTGCTRSARRRAGRRPARGAGAGHRVPRPVWTSVVGAEVARLVERRPAGGRAHRGDARPHRADASPRPRTRTGCSTSASPSSTPSPRPPGWPWAGCTRWSASTRRSSTGPSTRCSMDVALHRLPVTFVLDRAGVTGPDGAEPPRHVGPRRCSARCPACGWPRRATRRPPASCCAEAVADDDGPTAVRFPKGRVGPSLPALGRLGAADLLTPPGPPAEVLVLGAGPMAAAARRGGRASSTAAGVADDRGRPALAAAGRPRAGGGRGRVTGWWSPSRTAAWPAASATPSAGPCARPARAPTCSPWGCRSSSSSTASGRPCSPPRGWTPRASSAGCARPSVLSLPVPAQEKRRARAR